MINKHDEADVTAEKQSDGTIAFHYAQSRSIDSWYKDRDLRILHRVDGPAFISPTVKVWYRDGKLHREDGPAHIFDGGYVHTRRYYLNDKELSPAEWKRHIVKRGMSPKTNKAFGDILEDL